MFHVHMLIENFCIVVEKYILRQCFSLKLVLNLYSMFHQISGAFSYKIVLIKKVYSNVMYGQSILNCMEYLFRSTIGEIVKLIDISNKEWSALLEKIFYSTRRQKFPTFLRYALYSVICLTTLLYSLSVTYFLAVSLQERQKENL